MSISKHALSALQELGFALAPKPEYEIPTLPRDITDLDDEGLMDLFVQYTQWNDHLAGAQAIAAINLREAETTIKNAEATAILKNWTGNKKDTVAVLKAQGAASEEMQELRYDLDTKYAFHELIRTRTENIERDCQLVSRELTRRTSDGGLRSRQRRFVS
jgi:hypothetical protein